MKCQRFDTRNPNSSIPGVNSCEKAVITQAADDGIKRIERLQTTVTQRAIEIVVGRGAGQVVRTCSERTGSKKPKSLILKGKYSTEQDVRDTSCSVPVFKLIFGDIFVFNVGWGP